MNTSVKWALRLLAPPMLIVCCAFGENRAPSSIVTSACGPANVKFEVQAGSAEFFPLHPDLVKATIYLIQDVPSNPGPPAVTTRVGLDGAWIGALRGRSWIKVLVDPGLHHLCADGQWSQWFGPESIALQGIHAEGGKTYYFRVRFLNSYGGSRFLLLGIEAADDDEGQYLVESSVSVTSHPK